MNALIQRALRHCFLVCGVLALPYAPGLADETPSESDTEPAVTAPGETVEGETVEGGASVVLPVYRPPLLGAPAERLGASTRSLVWNDGELMLLVPPRGGLSATASPILFWHLTSPFTGTSRLVLSDARSGLPFFVLDETVDWQPGIMGFDLDDWGLVLPEGRIMRWRLILTDQASEQIEATNLLEHRRPEFIVIDERDGASAAFWAERGYWFDALAASAALPKERASLLASAGLVVPDR